ANAALFDWITRLGKVCELKRPAKLDESNLHLRPQLEWIADEARLGRQLSQSLRLIRTNRQPDHQFYVSLAHNVRNPSFLHELSYDALKFPDVGFQILSIYRFWNIIEYWFPYRNVLDEDWDDVLIQFMPRIALAKNANEYQRELMAL